MTNDELCFTPATALVPLIRRRKVSPLELMKAVLARIERVNPSLNAYCTVAAEQALAAARRATAALGKRGAVLGPLHGMPVGIKDLTPTKGMRTTWGSKVYAHNVPNENCLGRRAAEGRRRDHRRQDQHAGVRRGRQHLQRGLRRDPNPWNPALTSGGSSGGGAVGLATGSGPWPRAGTTAARSAGPPPFCGVVGFRTAPVYVPVWPGANLDGTRSACRGPMARTVADSGADAVHARRPRPARADLLSPSTRGPSWPR